MMLQRLEWFYKYVCMYLITGRVIKSTTGNPIDSNKTVLKKPDEVNFWILSHQICCFGALPLLEYEWRERADDHHRVHYVPKLSEVRTGM